MISSAPCEQLDDTGALGLGVLTGLENDVGSLTTGVGDDRVGLSALGDSLLLGLLGLVEALLDLLAALLHGFHDARQGDLGQHDPDNQEAISAGMNSAILGMRMSAPAAPSSANAETGMSSAAADAESAIALFWDERFILDAPCYLTISATTKPIRARASPKAEPMMKTVNTRPGPQADGP